MVDLVLKARKRTLGRDGKLYVTLDDAEYNYVALLIIQDANLAEKLLLTTEVVVRQK